MSKLLDFYKSILQDVDVIIDDNQYLKLSTENGEAFITRKKGKNILLPTKDVLNNFYIEDEEGNLIPKGLIFNPIKEHINENIGIDLLRDLMVAKLERMFLVFGNNLIITLTNPELQNELDIDLSMSIANLRKNVPGMKNGAKIADDTMLKNWAKLITETIESEDGMFQLLISADRSKKFNKIAKFLVNIYETLASTDEEEKIKIGKVTIRPKDKIVYKEIFKLLIPNITDKGLLTLETNNLDCPTFILALNTFYGIANRYKKFMVALEQADTVIAQTAVITNSFSKESIDAVNETFKVDKQLIPAENEINVSSKKVLAINNVANSTTEKKELTISNSNTTTEKQKSNKAFAPVLGQTQSSFTNNINTMNGMGQMRNNVPFVQPMFNNTNNMGFVQPQMQQMVQFQPQFLPQQTMQQPTVAQPKAKNTTDDFEIKPLNQPIVSHLTPHLNSQASMIQFAQENNKKLMAAKQAQLQQQMQQLQMQQQMLMQQNNMMANNNMMFNNQNFMAQQPMNGFNNFGMQNTFVPQNNFNNFNQGFTGSNFTSF